MDNLDMEIPMGNLILMDSQDNLDSQGNQDNQELQDTTMDSLILVKDD